MEPQNTGAPVFPPEIQKQLYDRLLDEARAVAQRVLGRLWQLHGRFPPRRQDQRTDPRTAVPPQPLTVRTAGAAAVTCRLRDRSRRGLGISLPRSVPVGSFLLVRPADAPAGAEAVAEVKHCRRLDDGWAVGCQFVDTHPSG
jgi:hypothetical protein